jgi:hypothetical protein
MRSAVYVTSMLLLGTTAWAMEQSSVHGAIEDTSGQVLPGVAVQVQNESTGVRWKTASNGQGYYSFPSVPPGSYKLTLRLAGFRTVSKGTVVLNAREERRLDFVMELLTLHETITVVSGRDEVDPSSGDSLIMKRNSPGANLPANGPDYRTLFDLMPGVVVTPASLGDGGQFTANGQRPNAHAFRIDGISANTGVGGSTLPGSFPGASLPAMSASGSMENLSASETVQTVELRTSNFAPEFGGRTGADTSITTRSGSNELHSAFVSRFRDSSWNARDWFANSLGLAYTRPNYRTLCGVIGGPILQNRTYYFLSVESSKLNDSGLELTSVPSIDTRAAAPASLQRILNVFPQPVGPDFDGGVAEGVIGIGRTASLSSYSGRIDQSLGSHGVLFVRYIQAPSSSYSPQTSATEGVSNWRSITIGLTAARSHGAIHDLRFNYSRADFRSTYMDNPWWPAFAVAGLLPSANSGGIWTSILSALPQTKASANVWGVYIPGIGQFLSGDYGRSRQDQWEWSDTIGKQVRRHQLRAGLNYVLLAPSRNTPLITILGSIPSFQSLLDSSAFVVSVTSVPRYGENVHALSVFAQDTFQVAESFNFVYGVRWEITPPTQIQTAFPSIAGLWTGTAWTAMYAGDVNATAPWPLRYGQVAPRIGLAYRFPSSRLVLRGGAGLFYDVALGAAINSVNGAPFNSWLLSNGTMGIGTYAPASNSIAISPPAETAPDVLRFLTGPHPALHLPASYQWKASLEQGFGAQAVASVTYVGSLGRHLLGNQVHTDPVTGVVDRSVTLTESSSSYHALQLRYSGSLGKNTYITASYAWSHCIDNGSADSSVFLIHSGYSLDEAKGSCNFDVRQALTAAVLYQAPRFIAASGVPAWLGGCTISGILRTRSGFPMNITVNEQALGQRFSNAIRPDLVAGQQIWLADDSVPGRRRLNQSAFRARSDGIQGTLGRNAIFGNGLAQFDASIRRSFGIYRSTSLEVGVNVFNVLNHPAFSDPVPALSSPWFGISTSMQNLMLGSGTPNTGLTPLFQTGGSRSVEIAFRVSF